MPRYRQRGSSVDYSTRNKERRKMTNYLRTGGFKKIAGAPIYSMSVHKRRVWFIGFGFLVIGVGFYYVFF
jgi:hypothetical protein